MAVLPIIIAPDPRLKKKCTPIEQVDDDIATLMADMLETMYLAPGIGLAAPQIGVTKQVIVVDTSSKDEDPAPIKMANPTILLASEELWTYEEGCLSLPDHYAEVERPAKIKVGYLDENNAQQELEAEELLAICIQHELHHLRGVLFIDHLPPLKQKMVKRRLAKQVRLSA